MALDNDFYFKTENDATFYQKWLIEELGYVLSDDPNWLAKEGVISTVGDAVHLANGIEENYGFKPNVSIYFRMEKFEKFYDGFGNLMDTIMRLLDEDVSDAVLLGPGGETMLLYKNEELSLQKESWSDKNLTLIDRPYALCQIDDM